MTRRIKVSGLGCERDLNPLGGNLGALKTTEASETTLRAQKPHLGFNVILGRTERGLGILEPLHEHLGRRGKCLVA